MGSRARAPLLWQTPADGDKCAAAVIAAVDEWGPRFTPSGAPYGSLHETECKQQFSLAFAHAMVAAARCTISDLRSDVERIDFTVRQAAEHTKYSSAQVDVQMKCTERDVLRQDGVHWSLTKDHYDALRDPKTINRKILVVLLVPAELDQWIHHSEERLLLRKSAYWLNLENFPEIAKDSKTVILPKHQVFDVNHLLDMLSRIGSGGDP